MGENFKKNLAIVDRLSEFAEKRGYNASQLALAWVLAKGEDIIPIPGTKRRKYLEENVLAVDIELKAIELSEIDGIFAPGIISGARY